MKPTTEHTLLGHVLDALEAHPTDGAGIAHLARLVLKPDRTRPDARGTTYAPTKDSDGRKRYSDEQAMRSARLLRDGASWREIAALPGMPPTPTGVVALSRRGQRLLDTVGPEATQPPSEIWAEVP